MELAIPLIAFGGLYVISNQKKKEPFKLQSHPNEYRSLPRENKHFVPPQDTGIIDNTEYTDLAGRTMNIKDQTSNMVPFFGKQKNIGNSSKTNDVRDSTLDNYTGAGTMLTVKTENAPLFKPQENIQWASGAPNQSDFFQSRVNPSTSMHNVKPFQEERVGPGMNKGYSSEGSGGFNSGMEARSQWLPKTVNELRVVTNPKETFELANHEGPAQSKVTNVGNIGKVEKYLPDKYYINTPDRYFTTTGDQKGQTLRSIQPDPTIHRATTTKSYAGVAGNSGPSQQPQHGMYRSDNRQPLKTNQFNPASTTVEKNNLNSVMNSIELLPNNRTTTKPESFSIMKGLVSAIAAPITDILRPTRKETFGLARVGALSSSVPQHSLPQSTKIESTIKESTIYSPYTAGQRAYKPVTYGGYQTSDHQPVTNQRDSTNVAYAGIAGSTLPQTVSYESAYNSMIKSNRANEGRIAGGNTQMFTPIINQENNNMKPLTHAPYSGMPQGATSIPNVEQFGDMRTPQSYSNNDRNHSSILEALKENPYNHSVLNRM
jgi:hypothetical protein